MLSRIQGFSYNGNYLKATDLQPDAANNIFGKGATLDKVGGWISPTQ